MGKLVSDSGESGLSGEQGVVLCGPTSGEHDEGGDCGLCGK